MKSRVLNAFAALAVLLPMSGQAANFGYSFVDFAVVPEFEADKLVGDNDGDGFQLRGSLAINETFFALVEIGDYELDNGVDFTRMAIGAGAHWPINQNLDFVARGGIVRYDADYRFRDDDDIGFFAGARVRARVAGNFEFEGGVDLTTAELAGFDDEITLVGEGRYHFNSQWSVGGFVNVGDDVSQIGVYGRFNF
jgi:hypothetical protein